MKQKNKENKKEDKDLRYMRNSLKKALKENYKEDTTSGWFVLLLLILGLVFLGYGVFSKSWTGIIGGLGLLIWLVISVR